MNNTPFNAAPPETIPVTQQSLFVGGTRHTIANIGGVSTEKFKVDSTTDFAVNAAIISGYDRQGSLYEQGNRTDLFEIQMKTDNTGLHWQSQAYDIRHFLELVRSVRFPGMYLAKGSELEVTIQHSPVAADAAPVPPMTFCISFFGSKVNLIRNPQYDAWLVEERRMGRAR